MARSIHSLTAFPFLSMDEIEQLKSQLPVSKVADLNSSIDPLQWWENNANSVPHRAAAARKVLLAQPSSECFFTIEHFYQTAGSIF